MSLEPKLITVPGIPGQLQEQTLDQFVAVLSPDHLARKQLDEIRNQALRSVELSTQLMQANDKILVLQSQLMKPTPELHAPPNKYVPDPELKELMAPTPQSAFTPGTQFPMAQCPNCQKPVSTRPNIWGGHQHRYHKDNPAPRPT